MATPPAIIKQADVKRIVKGSFDGCPDANRVTFKVDGVEVTIHRSGEDKQANIWDEELDEA